MTNPGQINSLGANPGGPTAPIPAGQSPLNQPPTATPPSTGNNPTPSGSPNDLTVTSLTQPPPLKTFIYAPQVRIVIAHGALEYDVSADLVRCQLVRPENSAATLFFTLINKGLRYTPPGLAPFFSRMDRVVVYMKKTSWIQVFAGYLDKVPYKQLYAGEVNFKATCTIKRLMHTWWDPALPQSQSLLNQLAANFSIDGLGQTDSGMGSMLRNLLVNVGGWNIADVHIQNFPTSFLQFLITQLASLQGSNSGNLTTWQQLLMGSNTSPGPGAYAGANANAGAPGPSAPSGTGDSVAGTAFYLQQIIAACDAKGLGPQPLDNTVSAGLIQAGAAGEASGGPFQNPGQQQAWQIVQQTGQQYASANRNSDGAILGVAAAMVETGGGASIRNLYNPAVPGSEAFPNDGPTNNGVNMGIFLLNTSWGTIAQCMNPQQAAGMFFAALQNVSGWRNMDPGQAIQQALIANTAAAAAYDAAIPMATTLVQTYRTSGALALSALLPSGSMTLGGTTVPQAASSIGAAAGGGGGAPSQVAGAVVGAASSMPSPGALLSTVNPTSTSSPQPNSEGAINFILQNCMGLPYIWGGTGPAGYDCSGLMFAAFKAIGVALPRTTQGIASGLQKIPNNSAQRGDLVEPNSGHVVMWMGDGTILEAQQTGVPIHQIPAYFSLSSCYGVYRACANGGPNPSAPYSPPSVMGPGVAPSAIYQTSGVAGAGSAGAQEPIARNLLGYMTGAYASDTAGLFTGVKAFIEGQPLIQMVQAVCAGSLRCWSSGPDGSFIAWYPDYWGLDGKPSVMLLADIEMKDCHIDFSDEPLTTHVYVNGDLSMTGQLQDPIQGWITTAGVATVEQPWLYARLLTVAPGDLDAIAGQQIMQRFGIRPMQQSFAMAGTTELEFLLACQIFMEQWAKQYQTTISMTFMPELFPGMRVELPDRNLQVYISAVSHSCDYEQGFLTQVTISAPSSPQAAANMGMVNVGTNLPLSSSNPPAANSANTSSTVANPAAPAPASSVVGGGPTL